jgi:hypothetical protein
MVSHAHGQGYADMHWVIPETIDRHEPPVTDQMNWLCGAGFKDVQCFGRMIIAPCSAASEGKKSFAAALQIP